MRQCGDQDDPARTTKEAYIPSYVTRKRLAKMMGLSEATLRSYVSCGEIPPPNVPVRIVEGGWTPEVILAWLEERKAARFHRPGPKPRQPSESDLEKLRAIARRPDLELLAL